MLAFKAQFIYKHGDNGELGSPHCGKGTLPPARLGKGDFRIAQKIMATCAGRPSADPPTTPALDSLIFWGSFAHSSPARWFWGDQIWGNSPGLDPT